MYLLAWKTISGERLWERFDSETLLKARIEQLQSTTGVMLVLVFEMAHALDLNSF